jgi:sortase B
MFYGDDDTVEEIQNLRRARTTYPIQDILSLQKQEVREIGAIISEGVGEADKKKAQLERVSDISDLYGWIRINGTNVDYPVVQAEDNDYYLYRNVYGHNQFAGSLYVDWRNDKNTYNNLNIIIYGHNMANGTMFSDLIKFGNNRDIFNNGLIEFITWNGIYYYEVFSAHIAHPMFYYRETDFESEEEYVRWLYEMKSLSIFENERVEFTAQSKIITLSTCMNTVINPRFAVHAVLVDVQRYSDR